jgi:hypothetical protein
MESPPEYRTGPGFEGKGLSRLTAPVEAAVSGLEPGRRGQNRGSATITGDGPVAEPKNARNPMERERR